MFPLPTTIIWVAIAFALTSNVLAVIPFFIQIRRGIWPRTCDFAAVSIILYYSLGLIAELSQPVQIGELVPLFGHSETSALISLALIAMAPWALRLGSLLMTPRYTGVSTATKLSISSRSRRLFCLVSCSLCTLIAGQSIRGLLVTDSLWTLQADTLAAWGPYILWFYIPGALLTLFVAISDMRSTRDKGVCLFLIITSICATIPLCERTLMLVPVLVVCLFGRRMTIRRLLLVPGTVLCVAAVMLPLVKPSFANDDRPWSELFFALIHGDISRAGVLAHAVDHSDVVGTQLLAYPMAGYVYAAAFCIPRSVAPWKGHSTAQTFTAAVSHTVEEDTDWGYGVGFIEEIVLNAGLCFSVPMLLCYGLIFGCIDRIRNPALVLPLRLGTLWIAGYHLPAMMQTFGPSVIVALIFVIAISGKKRWCTQLYASVRSVGAARCFAESRM